MRLETPRCKPHLDWLPSVSVPGAQAVVYLVTPGTEPRGEAYRKVATVWEFAVKRDALEAARPAFEAWQAGGPPPPWPRLLWSRTHALAKPAVEVALPAFIRNAPYARHAIWDRVLAEADTGVDGDGDETVAVAGASRLLAYSKPQALVELLDDPPAKRAKVANRGPKDQMSVKLRVLQQLHSEYAFG